MVIWFEYRLFYCEFSSLSNLKMYNIPTFALYQLNFYCHNHGLYKLWPFNLHIECLVAYNILSYKAFQILHSSCFLIPIFRCVDYGCAWHNPCHILDWWLKAWGLSKGDEICAFQLYPQLLWGLFHLCFFKCIGDGW